MTELRKAAEMALKRLDMYFVEHGNDDDFAALQALAQPEQEPVAWITNGGKGELGWRKTTEKDISLYTAPPKREWVGLTDDDLKPLCDDWMIIFGGYVHDFAKAIEAKLKEKNT